MSTSGLIVRPSIIDTNLVAISIGLEILLCFLFIVYLLVRNFRSRRPGYQSSKADIPFWVAALTVTGGVMIMGKLFSAGAIIRLPESANECSIIDFGVVYLAASLWISLCLYKLLRRHFKVRHMDEKPFHPLIYIGGLMTPPLLLSMVAIALDESWRNGSDMCVHLRPYSSVYLFAIVAIYAGLTIYYRLKLQKAIASHHDIYRYTLFLTSSLVYLLVEWLVQTTPLYNSLLAQQLLIALVIAVVIFNMGHIYMLVLRDKARSKTFIEGVPEVRDQLELGSMSSLSQYDNQYPPNDPMLDRLNHLLAEGVVEAKAPYQYNPPPTQRPPTIIMHAPRRLPSDSMIPPLGRYVDALPGELAAEVDRNRAFFAPSAQLALSGWNPNRRASLAAARNSSVGRRRVTEIEFDLDQAERILSPP